MNYADAAETARDIADALEDAQRALNHLRAIDEVWEESDDFERREAIGAAITRLDGTWSGRKVTA